MFAAAPKHGSSRRSASHFVADPPRPSSAAGGGVDGKPLPRHCFQPGTAASQPSSRPSPRDGRPAAEARPLGVRTPSPLPQLGTTLKATSRSRGSLRNGLRLHWSRRSSSTPLPSGIRAEGPPPLGPCSPSSFQCLCPDELSLTQLVPVVDSRRYRQREPCHPLVASGA